MTQRETILGTPAESSSAAGPATWVFLVIPALFMALRCVLAMFNELSADEAYYWVWSRSLAMGYLDHPPLIAWLIRGSCGLFGENELAVRLPAILLAGGTILLATVAGGLLGIARRHLLLLQVALACFPMLHIMGTISTPDTPAMFFVLLSLVAALLCLRDPDRWRHWLLLGVACGLAMLSKYTALLPVAAVLLTLLVQRRRHWYCAVVAGAIAVAVISPMIHWNYQRHWISFLFQLGHGIAPDERTWYMNVGDYIGGQLLVATPLLAPLLIWAGIRCIGKPQSPGHRLVAIASLFTLAFFFVTSFRHKVEANWPTAAWVPLAVLLATMLPGILCSRQLLRWGKSALIVAGIFTFVLLLPPTFLSRINKHSPLDKVGGWEALATRIRAATGRRPIICVNYQDASLFSFYTPGQPNARALRFKESRRTQFDQLPLPNLTNGFVLVSRRGYKEGDILRLFQGGRAFEVQIVSTTRHVARVDELTERIRYASTCRLLERDAATRSAYTGPTP